MNSLPTSEKSYNYTVYGLEIASFIYCPELPLGKGLPDVYIRYGSAPDSLAEAKAKGHYYEASPDQLLLSIERVGKYLISGGKEILIDRAPNVTDEEVRLFLLGSAFGALLHQRGLLPLHAAAFVANSGCVAVVGPSGLGKSTLAAAFRKRGYRIMADDVCVVSINGNGTPLVLPGYPQLKLWADSSRKLGERPESLPRVHPASEKHGLRLQEGFCQESSPLCHVYVLGTSNTPDFSLTSLKGREKLTAIFDNTYRPHFLNGLGGKTHHFKQCVVVATHAKVSRVTRPSDKFLLDELVELLENDFSKKIS